MTQPNGRDQIKRDILTLLILKHDSSCLVDDLRARIDKKAKEIDLRPSERNELIMEMRRIKKVEEEEMSE